jgi:hypothetical protein
MPSVDPASAAWVLHLPKGPLDMDNTGGPDRRPRAGATHSRSSTQPTMRTKLSQVGIILGEQMNTRGYDSSKLLPSHKGVGILRPDGESDAGADVLATTVRSHYMPNPE